MNEHTCPICLKPWRCHIPWCGLELFEVCTNCPNTGHQSERKRMEVISNATQNNGK